MTRFKVQPILRFLLWFVLAYAGLLILFSFFENQLGDQYRAMGKSRFEKFGKKGIVQFFPNEDRSTGYKLNTKVVLFNRDQVIAARQSGQATVKGGELYISSWYSFVLPITILLSLIIASPVPWKRKILAALVGLLLLYFFIVFKLRLSIANEYINNPELQYIPSNPKWTKVAHKIFVTNIETTIILPVFIWILVTFRKSDLSEFSSPPKG